MRLGQWVNYVIEPEELTVTGTGDNYDSTNYIRARITNVNAYENRAGWTYKIEMVNAGAGNDTFQWYKQDPSDGSWSSAKHVGIPGVDYTVPNPNAYGISGFDWNNDTDDDAYSWNDNRYWVSIDEGVQIWFSHQSGLDDSDEATFTIPTTGLQDSQKRFINGYSTCLSIPVATGNSVYTEKIPQFFGENYTVVFNYSKADLLVVGSGNRGLTLRFNYSMDETDWILGNCTHDDLAVADLKDMTQHVSTFDKKASGTSAYKDTTENSTYLNGGDFPYYRMELRFANLAGTEGTIGYHQHLDIAVIKNY